MTDFKLLRIYLNDHRAVLVGMQELAHRALRNNEGTPYGEWLRSFATELNQDRHALEHVMRAHEMRPDPIKPGAAWLAEKVGRLKLNGRLAGYSPLSRVIELEALRVSIEVNAALWRAIAAVDDDERIRTDAAERAQRATGHATKLQRFHATAVKEAFTPR